MVKYIVGIGLYMLKYSVLQHNFLDWDLFTELIRMKIYNMHYAGSTFIKCATDDIFLALPHCRVVVKLIAMAKSSAIINPCWDSDIQTLLNFRFAQLNSVWKFKSNAGYRWMILMNRKSFRTRSLVPWHDCQRRFNSPKLGLGLGFTRQKRFSRETIEQKKDKHKKRDQLKFISNKTHK